MKLKELFNTNEEREELENAFDPTMTTPDGQTFGKWWFDFCAEYETITDDREAFISYVRRIHPLIAAKWSQLLIKYPTLLREFTDAEDQRIITNHAAPNGDSDNAYSTGSVKEVWTETTTDEDIARLSSTRMIRNFWFDVVHEYDSLFIGVRAVWL